MSIFTYFYRFGLRFCALVLVVCIAGCTAGVDRDGTDGIFDPYETQNRKVHAFNRGLDRALVRPAAKGYTNILPDPVEDLVSNFAANLGEPADMTNGLLQGDMQGVGTAAARFLINSTIGILGVFDVATEMGIQQYDTNFGETLYVMGADEGPYVELPVLGPSNRRDAWGIAVDLFTNPLSYVVGTPEAYYAPIATGAARLGDRGRYSDVIDNILYESADSYAQARLIYLQNRRFDLGQEDPSASEIDPFALDTEGF
ncbi:MAG: VacJ family lipoprotein [Pseudomonadota bacterium]